MMDSKAFKGALVTFGVSVVISLAVFACGPAHVFSPATVEQVEACDDATYYDDQFQRCLSAMTRINDCGGENAS